MLGEVSLLNQARATGRLEIAAESVRGLKGLGVAGGIAGTAMDGIGVYNYYHPTAENFNSRVTPNKAAVDGGMTALGIWGGLPGEGTAAFYFGVDAFYPGGVAGFGSAQVSEPINGVVITGSL